MRDSLNLHDMFIVSIGDLSISSEELPGFPFQHLALPAIYVPD
jgi:hypothetical protein